MKKTAQNHRRHAERGAAMTESVLALTMLFLLFFGMLQIFQWGVAAILTGYSSFFAAKAQSLGYNYSIALKSARLAAMGASGEDMSKVKMPRIGNSSFAAYKREVGRRCEDYMRYGDAGNYGVKFKAWDSFAYGFDASSPQLEISYRDYAENEEYAEGGVVLRRLTILPPGNAMRFFTPGAGSAEPRGAHQTYRHAKHYMQ